MVHHHLRATRGGDQLTNPDTSRALLESVAYRHNLQHWYAHIFLLMPDHCHALLSFPPDRTMARTVRDWKRWPAAKLHLEWQIDFFDHRLRSTESHQEKYDYILQNPARAGYVTAPNIWPHVWHLKDRE